MSLCLVTPAALKTTFEIPRQASADVSLRRIQNMRIRPGETFKWTFGDTTGTGKADADGLITIPGLKIIAEPRSLVVGR